MLENNFKKLRLESKRVTCNIRPKSAINPEI